MRIGVVGSRRRNTKEDKQLLEVFLFNLIRSRGWMKDKITFVSGGCEKGADNFIKELVKEGKFPGSELVEHYPNVFPGMPYWDVVNAMYARNEKVAADSGILVAMVAPDRKGGTENTVKHANRLKVEVVLV
jgi:hypothetical protein